MAQRTVHHFTDDIDGTPDASTVLFGYAGKQYEIELSEENTRRLEDALAPYLDVARPVRNGKPAKRTSDVDPKAVRAWAQANGVEVSQRGRIKAEVVEQWRQAAA